MIGVQGPAGTGTHCTARVGIGPLTSIAPPSTFSAAALPGPPGPEPTAWTPAANTVVAVVPASIPSCVTVAPPFEFPNIPPGPVPIDVQVIPDAPLAGMALVTTSPGPPPVFVSDHKAIGAGAAPI